MSGEIERSFGLRKYRFTERIVEIPAEKVQMLRDRSKCSLEWEKTDTWDSKLPLKRDGS